MCGLLVSMVHLQPSAHQNQLYRSKDAVSPAIPPPTLQRGPVAMVRCTGPLHTKGPFTPVPDSGG